MRKLLFSILLSALPFITNAETVQIDGIWYKLDSETASAEVTLASDGTKYTGDVIIPEKVKYDGKEYSVGSIGNYAFQDCDKVINVSIPNSITSIRENAFNRCNDSIKIHVNNISVLLNLKGNPIPGLTRVGYFFFHSFRLFVNGCEIKELVIPDNVTIIRDNAFRNCLSLNSVIISNSVTDIGSDAFKGCLNLTNVAIGDSMINIGDEAFHNTAWYRNQSDGVLYLNKNLYDYKGEMPTNTSIIIKEGTTRVEDKAFSNCTNLISVTIPNSVTNIDAQAFYHCEGLTEINMGNSVSKIEWWAFLGCSALTSITIPKSVKNIDMSAFGGCDKLMAVHITDIKAWCNITFENEESNPLYCAKNLYLNGKKIENLKIPESVSEIKKYVFSRASGLVNITIPNSVTSIGERAFSDCIRLSRIDIPNSVTNIGDEAFMGCVGLKDIVIPNSVTNIGKYEFANCTGLTNLTIPNSVTNIGFSAFKNCIGLTNVTIPNSVTNIEEKVFEGCINLTGIVVDEGNKFYDSRDNCNAIIETSSNTLLQGGLSTIIPNSVTCIGRGAFYGCTNLTNIVIPNSVTCIRSGAFFGCTNLTSITIPNSVTIIGDKYVSSDVFYGCEKLTAVYITDMEAWCKIEFNAVNARSNPLYYAKTLYFNGEKVENLVIPELITNIGDYAFHGCTSLTSVTIPGSVTNIGRNAFSDCVNINKIICHAIEPPTCGKFDGSFIGIDKQKCVLYVPKNSKAAYQTASQWKDFLIIEDVANNIDDVTISVETELLPIYNLQGVQMKINKENLPAGVYIQNGKKIIIR